MFKQDINVQGRKLMDMLTVIVGHLDDFERMTPALEALGQRHVAYGVRPEHYATLTTALTWAIGVALDRDFSADVRNAWIAVLDDVAAAMKSGAAAVQPHDPPLPSHA